MELNILKVLLLIVNIPWVILFSKGDDSFQLTLAGPSVPSKEEVVK